MTIAALMVYVDSDSEDDGHVRIASSLALKFDSFLIGVSACPGVTTNTEVERLRHRLADRARWFRQIAGLREERVEWRYAIEPPDIFLVNEARAADLVILRNPSSQDPSGRRPTPAEAVLKMGRPTLLVPDQIHKLRFDHVVVGWKDVREARVAVRDALPFLHLANRVTVVEICVSTEQDAARRRVRDVERYLGRHGIECQMEFRVHLAEPAALPMMRLAREMKADLMVTGAYGHSRLGEWFFGGVTSNLLQDAPFCLLMSH